MNVFGTAYFRNVDTIIVNSNLISIFVRKKKFKNNF